MTISGLVAITPAAGYVNSVGAIVIGLLAGVTGLFAVQLKFRHGYDDSLDVVGVHDACGVLGTLSVGVLATRTVNPRGRGLTDCGGFHQLGVQALGVVVAATFAFTVIWLLAQFIQRTIGLRAPEDFEVRGLDQAVHAESAYEHGGFGSTNRAM